MRLLKRKPSRKKKAVRTAPTPTWKRHAIRLGCAAAFLTVTGGLTGWAISSGLVDEYTTAARDRFIEATALSGLVVTDVLVEGRKEANRSQLLDALQVQRGDNIISIDLTAARERLEALSWVKQATVERQLPGTIFVTLVERQPMALWQRKGRLYLVDDEGEIITRKNLKRFASLPVLIGDKAPVVARAMLETLGTEPEMNSRVEALTWVGDRRWTIRLENGVDIQLPEENPAAAWAHFVDLERNHKLLERDVIAIDLRLPDQLVVRVAPDAARQIRTPGKDT